ncbi:hypothetical protein CVT26_004027 [Gymnopilus dilepis]|uniref:G domain-containing protein n=1 Tax=Gymnopilus dilepis TaxID=231916 RepID=A0A409W1Y0_9AGAR|nr:hypothetical protein CVT26_004027 [Gymnopilus dilepis]
MPRYQKTAPRRRLPKCAKWEDADPCRDIVIIIVGETGVGISTFIKRLLDNNDRVHVRELDDADLESCTKDITPFHVDNNPEYVPPGHRLVVLDTPGFNNSSCIWPDLKILQRIEEWLQVSYSPGVERLGVIYLHDITQSRVSSETLLLFKGLNALCRASDRQKTSVILATTKWPGDLEGTDSIDALRREDQLENKFWQEMIQGGAGLGQFTNTKESAKDVVKKAIEVILRQVRKADECVNRERRPWKCVKKKSKYLQRFGTRAQKGYERTFEGKSGDIIVAVMGPTGVGKSTFVKHLIEGKLPKTVVRIGHDLESCTSELQPIPIPFDIATNALPGVKLEGKDRRLVIVDTPGFDDTYENDSAILQRIAEWLAICYSKETRLGGVIYLHDISQPRMLGTYRKNLDMFSKLCGKDAWDSVLLVTNKWGEVKEDVGGKREVQLRDKFWGEMLKHGAQMSRFFNDSSSAWTIVQELLMRSMKSNFESRLLRIQAELVEMEKIIPATDAGKQLRYTIEEVLKMMQSSEQGGVQEEERQKLLEKLLNQMDQLKVPLFYRLKRLFSP